MNYILDFADYLTQEQIDAVAASRGITLIKQFGNFGNVFLGSADSEPSIDDILLSAVLDDPNGVDLLGIDIAITDSTETRTFDITEEQNWWKLATVNSVDFDNPSYTCTIRGHRSTVYILDSGIKLDHQEFAGKDITLLHSFTGEFNDTNGHGTAIASIISGNTCAIASPKLKILKIFQNGIPTLQSDLVAALDALLNDFLANSRIPSVVNISWAIPYNEYINSKFQYMIDQGIYIIAAAGNNGMPISNVTPACVDDVVVVGSYNQNLEPSNFSNYTAGSDISFTASETNYGALDGWAPGEQIWAANLTGGYGYTAGTSIATAIASSAFAYNIDSIALTDDFDYDHIFPNSNTEFYKSLKANTFIKKELLNLSGNYVNSVNRIATVRSSPITTITKGYALVVPGGTTYQHYGLALTKGVKRITSDSDLPAGVEISNYGVISVTSNNITEPFIKLVDIELTLHLSDETTRIVNLVAYTIQQGYTKQELKDAFPEQISNEPLLINLLDAICTDSPEGPCYDGGCNDFCQYQSGYFVPGFCYGDESGKGTTNCFCQCEVG